jgi:hypothetical protein
VLSLILDYLLKNSKLKNEIIRLSFFTFQGLLGSVIINDVFRILFGDFKEKEMIQYGIASVVAVAPYISPKLAVFKKRSNNLALGFGLATGTLIACMSAKQNPKKEEEGKS